MTDPIRELPLSIDDQLKGLDLSIMRLVNPPQPLAKDNWEALNSFGGEFGGPAKRCLFDLRDRLAAVEARLPWVGTAADVAPQVVPATTADGLSPVEPAPQAPQGVTVEELVDCLPNPWKGDFDAFARYLLAHPRIGPLLRGEGAPATAPGPVVLPEEPNSGPALYELNRTRDRGCFLAGWLAYRAEVARQQGGQADG